MQTISQINNCLSNKVPLYGAASSCLATRYENSYNYMEHIYDLSQQKVDNVKKESQNFKKQMQMIATSSFQELLQTIEERLSLEYDEQTCGKKTKVERVKNVLYQAKEIYLMKNIQNLATYGKDNLERSKQLGIKYILPLYFTLKASTLVCKEMIIEMIQQRLGQLQMTFNVSKDTVTMLFAGKFNEKKIVQKVESNLSSFKELTLTFVQKGLEVKVSKKDLFENYHVIILKLSEILNEFTDKGRQQIIEAKNKTVNLYKKVLERIKEKQIKIRDEFMRVTSVPQVESQKTPQTPKVVEESKTVSVEAAVKEVEQKVSEFIENPSENESSVDEIDE